MQRVKNIIVTGANNGIGLETAKKLAGEHKVFLACRSQVYMSVRNSDV